MITLNNLIAINDRIVLSKRDPGDIQIKTKLTSTFYRV